MIIYNGYEVRPSSEIPWLLVMESSSQAHYGSQFSIEMVDNRKDLPSHLLVRRDTDPRVYYKLPNLIEFALTDAAKCADKNARREIRAALGLPDDDWFDRVFVGP